MDTASTLIGIGLLLLFVAPAGYLLFAEGSQNRKFKKQFLMLSKQNNLVLSQSQIFPDLSLGLDEISKKLIVFIAGKTPKAFFIDLNNIKSAEVQKKYSDVNSGKNNVDDICEIVLNLKLKNPSSEENRIIFFGGVCNSVLQKEARLNSALKWNSLIQNSLKK